MLQMPAMDDLVWVQTLAAQTQRALAPIEWSSVDDVPAAATRATYLLPAPRNHAEELLLRSLLVEAAAKFGSAIHRRAHVHTPLATCGFAPAPFLESFWTAPSDDPRRDFANWASVFVSAFRLRHPRTAAERAALILRTRYAESWPATVLAKAVAVSRATLAREFGQIYGASIHEYHRLARVAVALDRLSADTLESTALDVGYKSRKDLYQALQKTVGITPTEFRALGPEPAWEVCERLRLRLEPM